MVRRCLCPVVAIFLMSCNGVNKTSDKEPFVERHFVTYSAFQIGKLPRDVHVVSPDEVEKVWYEKDFLLVFSSEGCGASSPFWEDVASYAGDLDIYVVHQGEDEFALGDRLDRVYALTHYTNPSMFMIRDGHVVDVSRRAMYYGGLDAFVRRHLTGFSLAARRARPGNTPKARLRTVLIQNELSYLDLRGVNLEGLTLKKKNFEGSDLRNAIFEGGELHGVNFSHADLMGARLPSVEKMSEIFWGSCRCPDGSLSQDHGLTCLGHLAPAQVNDIEVDPAPSQDPDAQRHRALIEALD